MRVPILTYHAIEDGPGPLFISPAKFAAQVASLADSGFATVSPAALVDCMRGRASLPEKPVVICFDDGYASVMDAAFPILRDAGFTATVFLVTDYCGRDNRWPSQPGWVSPRQLLSWEQAAILQAAGWEIGAHTRTHPPLTQLHPTEAKEEIVQSQTLIVEHLGQPCRMFAYPYGLWNRGVVECVRERFAGAVSTRLGVVSAGSDPFLLERIDAFYLFPGWLRRMESPLFRLYLRLARALRVARRSVTTAMDR